MSYTYDTRCFTRRQFMRICGVTAAIAPQGIPFALSADSTPYNSGHGAPLREFTYADVQLAPGPHETQLEQAHGVLMGLSEDSLLRPFRLAAQMHAPGNDLGGWYSNRRYLGETFGQWISALSRYYGAKADQSTLERVDSLISEFAKTVEPTGNIFLINGNPAYLHEKLVIGLNDAALYCRNREARNLLSKLMDASRPVLVLKSSPHFYERTHQAGENYNFADTYFKAGRTASDSRYLEMAKRDLDDGFIEPLSRGDNVLENRHAYSHTNALCGAAEAYLSLGDQKFLRAAINGLRFAEQQSFATGAFGPGESFLPKVAYDSTSPVTGEVRHYVAIDTLGASLLREHDHFETGCGSYAHMKLTRYLIRITKDARYGDSMERVMYNCALGALPIHKLGKAFYQSNYQNAATKAYFDGYENFVEDEWPCCSGTLPQLAADYRISSYFFDDEGIFVNLYIPSTVRWSKSGRQICLTQTGSYPLSDKITLVVDLANTETFTLRLRIPEWTSSPSLVVNGTRARVELKSGTFAELRRRWRSGDRIELTLPKHLHLKVVDAQHPNLVALCCGPLVLFAVGAEIPKVDRQLLLSAKQVAPDAPEWRAGNVRLTPWWHIGHETYTTYHDVSAKLPVPPMSASDSGPAPSIDSGTCRPQS
ncbi:beta-L-arabinofuranosidase domain-containing protein [Peristeroidobacter agariperforans]|uniref:beta-L-arabinofuranosidase domain-containing protein n=1 Tax=Peristeroidobacter agariperforans TaxID=268404 RepID=UPI00101BC749|nr:beta-L-arabinofuranosidase domain-containing protein [Peristeroidobacter agariperforans]